MKPLLPCLVSVVALLSAVPARSADAGKTPQEIEKVAKGLVLKLGDRDFREREAASRALERLGLAALMAIEEGLENPVPEIADRCETLIPKIRTLDLKRRLEEFAADREGRIANTLPVGGTYEKICGTDANARKFYIELCRKNLKLLDEAASNPKTAGAAYVDFFNGIDKRGTGVSPTEPEAAGLLLAALLLIGADEKIGPSIDEANRNQPKGDRTYQRLIGVLWMPTFAAAINDSESGLYLRKLMFAWAKRLPEPLAVTSFTFFVRDMIKKHPTKQLSDPDALEYLMDLATSTSSPRIHQKGEAMSMVAEANISEPDRIAFFEDNLFKDETTLVPDGLFDVKGRTKIRVETRACDYALAVCVKLSGQSFADYGFDILGPHSDMFSWIYAGFTKDETRKAAFKKYADWRKANPLTKDEPQKGGPK